MTHLYRGAPIVRSWSKYQATVKDWTLCGVRRTANRATRELAECTEDALLVDCQHCLQLMQPSAKPQDKSVYPQEAA